MSTSSARLGTERMRLAYGWRFAYLLAQGGSSLALFAALSHILGRSAFTETAVAQGVIVVAFAIGDFGLAQAAVTVLPARIAAAPERTAELLGGAASAFVVAAGAGAVLAWAAVAVVPSGAALPVAVIAPAAAATVVVSGADGLLRAQGEFWRPVMIVALGGFAAFVAVPVAAVTGSATWTCVAISGGTVIGSLPAFATLARLHPRPRRDATGWFARAALPLGGAQLFSVLGTRADTLVGGAVSGLAAAATFEGTWRVYQLGQYALGAVSTGVAPFIADRLGAGRYSEVLRLLRRWMVLLTIGGCLAGVVIYVARRQLATVVAGSIAGPVGGSVLPLALVSPLAIAGTLALYTLVGRDGHRGWVLVSYAAGSALNCGLAVTLAPSLGARGLAIACAGGVALTNAALLARLLVLRRQLRAGRRS